MESLCITDLAFKIITARIWRMGEVLFSICLSVHTSTGGGLPQLAEWGGGVYPVPGPDRGYSVPGPDGGTLSQIQTGMYSHLRSGPGGSNPADGGTTSKIMTGDTPGYLLIKDWMGYHYCSGLNGVPLCPGLDEVPPCPGLNEVPPCPGLNGVPPVKDRMGYTPPPHPGLNEVDSQHSQDFLVISIIFFICYTSKI